MNRGRLAQYRLARWLATAGALLVLAWPTAANAIASAHYQIQEDFLGGAGSSVGAASASYSSSSTTGATAVGDSASTTYRTQSGATTTNDPNLSFSVNTSSVSFGALNTGSATTAQATFSVLNYTSYGYAVTLLGSTPSNGAHNLTAMTGTSATAGTEQFGFNLVANTLPTTFGAAPQQVPDSTFSFGAAASGYNTANQYKFNSGDTIASAPKTSGQTTYTMAYVANISKFTPPGAYTGAETLICTGTY
jgi:hypothetical protein